MATLTVKIREALQLVFEPEAKRLLSRIENVAHHYEVRARVQ